MPINVWTPTAEILRSANIAKVMAEKNITDVAAFHRFSVTEYENFWNLLLKKLHIVFDQKPTKICDLSQGIESPNWFPGAQLNLVKSCFTAQPSDPALLYLDKNQALSQMSYHELDLLSNRVANSLVKLGYQKGVAIGIAMPMNYQAIAIYLGIIKMGGVVVSIADSFSTQEMQTRLDIAKAQLVFTQSTIKWDEKRIPLYEKIKPLPIKAIVLMDETPLPLRVNDLAWEDFLVDDDHFDAIPCAPMSACNILFSSGTTGVPKAIPWNHTTGIKAASDAFFHQNIKARDVLAWPTNLGWMMGPWLIYAALINQATIALFPDSPKGRAFGEFVARAKVTMLGVVPTLVATWHQSRCMENLDWEAIKVFSSTGECSNPEDMSYLMSLANNKPVIEYCGGTEIGGAYLSSTVIETNYPSLFSTPTMGLEIAIIDENGHVANLGEIAIVPPALGLSTTLLNANHHEIYYAHMPMILEDKILRRHGDEVERLPNHYYCVLGRVDDTMNLGGIKVSAAEIERTLAGFPGIIEVAAIAIAPPTHGPSQLVIYAATKEALDKKTVRQAMQKKINAELNPLFKIEEVIFLPDLPKTASNKIMRRVLRDKALKLS